LRHISAAVRDICTKFSVLVENGISANNDWSKYILAKFDVSDGSLIEKVNRYNLIGHSVISVKFGT